MSKNKYLLTIRFPFEALDTMDARKVSSEILDCLSLSDEEKKRARLQEVFKDRLPEGIEL